MAQADSAPITVDKDYFYTRLSEFYSDQKNKQKKPWSLQRHSEVMQIITASKQASLNRIKRTNEQYYFGNHYDILEIGGAKKVIKKRKNEDDSLIFLVPYENIYDELLVCHQSTGHGGRDKMKAALSHTMHIHRTCIEIFLKCCKRCTEKKSQSHKAGFALSKICNDRGQVDLIDLQASPDGEYKWLLHYQDLSTRFIHLRPLKSKVVEAISLELLKIFLEFGAPQILQSDDDEVINAIIKDLAIKWPECKIVIGRSIVKRNRDVEDMLKSWLKDNATDNWSLGCFYVQWRKNSSYHGVIGRSPYKAVFGVDFKVGLNSTNLPIELINRISTEEELYDTLKNRSVLQDPVYVQPEIQNDLSNIKEVNIKQEFSEADCDKAVGTEEDLLHYVEDSCVKDEPIKISEVKIEYLDPDNANKIDSGNADLILTEASKNMEKEAAQIMHPTSEEQKILQKTDEEPLKEYTRRYKRVNRWKCKICGYVCTSKLILTKHMAKHSGEKTYKCDICNAQFPFHSLKKHKLMHIGRKPFKCDICCKEFRHIGSLNVHKKQMHIERPFECEVCKRIYIRKNVLVQHMKTHEERE